MHKKQSTQAEMSYNDVNVDILRKQRRTENEKTCSIFARIT